MPDGLIYEKTFPSVEEAAGLIGSDDEFFPVKLTFEKLLDQWRNPVLEEIPDRKENADWFIHLGKKISEAYEVNTRIVQQRGSISIVLTFPSSGSMGFLKPLFELADDYSFIVDDKSLCVILCYYTHAEYRDGKRVAPPTWEHLL